MKLHINEEDNNNKVASPVAPPLPQARASNFPTHSFKTNNPSTIVPHSTNLSNHVGLDSVLVATLEFLIDSFINMSNIRTETTGLSLLCGLKIDKIEKCTSFILKVRVGSFLQNLTL